MKEMLRAVLLLALVMNATPARAQQPDYVPDKLEVTEEGKKVGWAPMLKASGTLAFSHAQNVVGTDDGSTWNIGLVIDGGLDWRHKAGHVWENVLKYQLTYNRTPLLDEFYKSLDNLDVSSTYMYELPKVPWLGPFASFRLVSSLLPGYLIRPGEVHLKQFDRDGNTVRDEPLSANERVNMTEAFSPTTLRESAGFFAKPVSRKHLEFQTRLGVGAWEVFTRDGYALDSDKDNVVVIKQMQDSFQAGGELEMKAKGVLATGVNYGLRASFMQPFYHNAETELEGLDLLNMEFEASLGIKLSGWASLDYAFKAYQYPLIVDEWQITNSLLLTATASIL